MRSFDGGVRPVYRMSNLTNAWDWRCRTDSVQRQKTNIFGNRACRSMTAKVCRKLNAVANDKYNLQQRFA